MRSTGKPTRRAASRTANELIQLGPLPETIVLTWMKLLASSPAYRDAAIFFWSVQSDMAKVLNVRTEEFDAVPRAGWILTEESNVKKVTRACLLNKSTRFFRYIACQLDAVVFFSKS